jgi:hypothetical protein
MAARSLSLPVRAPLSHGHLPHAAAALPACPLEGHTAVPRMLQLHNAGGHAQAGLDAVRSPVKARVMSGGLEHLHNWSARTPDLYLLP